MVLNIRINPNILFNLAWSNWVTFMPTEALKGNNNASDR